MTTQPTHRSGRIKWLVLALILLSATPLLSAFVTSGDYLLRYMLLAIWVGDAVPIGALLTLSFWVGMGRAPVVWRILGGLAGAVYITAMTTAATNIRATLSGFESEERSVVDLIQTMTPYAVVILLFGGMFMLIGRHWKLELPETKSVGVPDKFQFSILHILFITTSLAVLFTLMRAARSDGSPPSNWQIIAAYLLGFGTFFINTTFAAFAALRPGPTRRNLTLVAIISLLLGLAVSISSGHGALGWQTVAFGTLAFSVPTLVVALSLFVVRSCGYRLVRVSQATGAIRPDSVVDTARE